MKNLIFLFLVLYVSVCAQPLTPELLYDKYKNSVFVVNIHNEKGLNRFAGSAVYIEGNMIVTNYHVVDNAVKINFISGNDTIKDPDYLGFDPETDLAIFRYSNEKYYPFKLRSTCSVKPGEKVYALGNPGGYCLSVSEGIISAVRRNELKFSNDVIQFTSNIAPGSSGGALFDANGDLIGITSLAENEYNLYFAVPSDEINKISVIETGDSSLQNEMNNMLKKIDFSKLELKGTRNYSIKYSLFEKYPSIMKEIALFYAENYDVEVALDIISSIENSDIAPVEIYKLKAKVAAEPDSSIYYYSKAIECDPADHDLYYEKANINFDLKNYSEAFIDFQKAIELYPDNGYYKMLAGASLIYSGDTIQGVKYLDNSYEKSLEYADFYDFRGHMYSSAGDYYHAIYNFTKAINSTNDNAEYLFSRAICYIKYGQPKNALKDYLEYIKLEPLSSSAYNNLGYTYLDLDDYKNAYICFNKALELDEYHFDSYLGLALMSYRQKKIHDAGKYMYNAQRIKKVLKKGIKGIYQLKKDGYFWGASEIRDFNEIFKEFGFQYDKKKLAVRAVRGLNRK